MDTAARLSATERAIDLVSLAGPRSGQHARLLIRRQPSNRPRDLDWLIAPGLAQPTFEPVRERFTVGQRLIDGAL